MRDRRAGTACMLSLGLALATLGTATAAAQVPSTAVVHGLAAPAGPNYAAQPGQQLRQLSPAFVQSQLGLPTADPLARALHAASEPPSPPAAPVNLVRSPTYHCVNGRQTEDPLSPPCVSNFSGDNGGATYPGVSANEIRLLVVIAPAEAFDVVRHPPWGSYYDLAAPPTADEQGSLQYLARLRLYQAYFNSHFEIYGRRVHFFAYSANLIGLDADQGCRNVAAENYALIHPFSVVLPDIGELIPPCYGIEMSRHGALTFDADRQIERTVYQQARGLMWGLRPDDTEAVTVFSSYVCQKVVQHRVALSGNPGENGGPRRIGLLHPSDLPEYIRFAAAVRQRVLACGADIVDEETTLEPYGTCSTALGAVSNVPQGYPFTDVAKAIAGFRERGVTTVLWPGCMDARVIAAAEFQAYEPEWVLWGAGELDKAFNVSYAGAMGSPLDGWSRHAVVVTPVTFKPEIHERVCFRAMTSVDPAVIADDEYTWAACDYYDGLRQVFSALQLAGPRLTPMAIDKGLRAVAYSYSEPQVPRCAYPVGDHTCIKDFQVDWWDRSGASQPSGGVGPTHQRTGGCWRAMDAGRRYQADSWPPGNIDAQLRPTDPCSYQGSWSGP